MKIGITERGDAGIDLSWYNKLSGVSGAILITKCITDTFIDHVIQAFHAGHKLIIHATCTGWGSSVIEPNVPPYSLQLQQLKQLINYGFPIDQCVLRIDPIFPTKNGLKRVCEVLDLAFAMELLPYVRVRISVLDEYPHVKERLKRCGYKPVYGDKFYAPKHMMEDVIQTLNKYDMQFHTCAEPFLDTQDGLFVHSGCVSEIDLNLMGLSVQDTEKNPQNRRGCTCLSCKTELLTAKHPCSNGCIYCYWKD